MTSGNSKLSSNQIVIQSSEGWFDLKLNAVWRYRELLSFLVWRDIKVRYKQTALGVAWVVIQPLVSMLVFSGLFGVLLEVPTGGVPYPVFVLTGLLPWQYFSGALTKATNSVVDSSALVSKIYFPRLIIPMAGVLSGLVDLAISGIFLVSVLLFFKIPLTLSILTLPFFILLAVITALGFGLWLSALNVRYRDVRHLMPFLMQVWMYLTPVVYGATLIPEEFRWLLAINPMTGVVEGFRWALLSKQYGQAAPSTELVVLSSLIALLVLLGGLIYYRHTERNFADII